MTQEDDFKMEMKKRTEKVEGFTLDMDDGLAIDIISEMFEFLMQDIEDNFYNGLLAGALNAFEYWVKECQDGDVKRGF